MTKPRIFDSAPATLPLMLKAALPAIPLVGGLPGIKHQRGAVPDLVLQRPNVAPDLAHLIQYRQVCGFAYRDSVPVTYPHMAAFGLHMTLMTDTSFPFAPMGLVHLRNSITQRRPIAANEPIDVAVRAEGLRPHPKGQLIDVITDIAVDGEQVWSETTTLFSRGKGGAEEATQSSTAGIEAPRGAVHWKLSSDLGREYAAVSGDRNPIHLHPLTAKPFGFKSHIAHGMWTKARCLAAIENRLGDAFTVDVEFQKPILLPNTVVFGSHTDGDRVTFGVTGAKKPQTHVVGRIQPR